MKTRLIFQCSCCGSTSFRRSTRLSWKDSLLQKFGINKQRCHLCRRHFYLFKPSSLRAFLIALDARPSEGAGVKPALDGASPRWLARQDSNL